MSPLVQGVFNYASSATRLQATSTGSDPTLHVWNTASGLGIRGSSLDGVGIQAKGATTGLEAEGDVVGVTAKGGTTGVRAPATTRGVQASASSIGVEGTSTLRVEGRAEFALSGVATVRALASTVSVRGLRLGPASVVFAMLQQQRPGVWVVCATPDTVTRESITIQLNLPVVADTRVAWFVVN